MVLYDRRTQRAEGEAWDIANGTPMLRSAEVFATDRWEDVAGVEVVVVTVGGPFKSGQSRLDEHRATSFGP